MLIEYALAFVITGASDGRSRTWEAEETFSSYEECAEERRRIARDLPDNVKAVCKRHVVHSGERDRADDD